MLTGIGSAYAKIILIGEHSVVYGYPAIALSLPDLTIRVTVNQTDLPYVTIEDKWYNGKIDFSLSDESPLIYAIQAALNFLKVEAKGLHIKTDSQIPHQRGLGSSAAIGSAVIRALFSYFNRDLDLPTLMELATQAEKIAHENPSGLDVYVCNHQEKVLFIKDKLIQPLNFELDAYLVIADTQIKGQTKQAVNIVKQKYTETRTQQILAELGQLTNDSLTAIQAHDLVLLGTYLSQAHKLLQELGVSCEKLDRLVATALTENVLGAKLTGGGLGGNMIALVKTQEHAQRLATKLQQQDIGQIWIQKI